LKLANPTLIYFSISILALYGDIVKRILPAGAALGVVYAAAILILLMMMVQRRTAGPVSAHRHLAREAQWVNLFTGILIVTYIAQFLTSFNSPFAEGLSHLLYMVIPLSFILVVQKARFNFSLAELAKLFLWMMIPINIVGLIQFGVDPSFLISTSYSGNEMGGVIARNLLEGGVFNRYPSIFASADRYSAMGLMQFYFSWMLLTAGTLMTRKAKLWLAFNLLSSFVALGIAGARSRVLIVVVVLLLIVLSEAIQIFGTVLGTRRGRASTIAYLLGGITVVAALVVPMMNSEDYPIVLLLQQSLSSGDINMRFDEAVLFSFLPKDVSLFGAGLGTIGVGGKPGEFGIMSTWAESGLIWGGIILLAFFAICLTLAKLMFKAILTGQLVRLVMVGIPLLLLIFALLSGLTSSFELSSGILLGCAIAVALRRSYHQQRY